MLRWPIFFTRCIVPLCPNEINDYDDNAEVILLQDVSLCSKHPTQLNNNVRGISKHRIIHAIKTAINVHAYALQELYRCVIIQRKYSPLIDEIITIVLVA